MTNIMSATIVRYDVLISSKMQTILPIIVWQHQYRCLHGEKGK